MLSVEYIIREHPFFKGMSEDQLDHLIACAHLEHYDAGESIFCTGDAADRFYLIGHGNVSLEMQIPKQGFALLQTLREGDVLGCSWPFPPYRWYFDARAVTPTCVVYMDSTVLRSLCAIDHELGYELVRRVGALMLKRLEATRLQILDLYCVPMSQQSGLNLVAVEN